MDENTDVIQIATHSCETFYKVNNNTIRLWMITGGTPALGFNMLPYDKRYPSLELWSDKNWSVRYNMPNGEMGCYVHQIGQAPIQGPTPETVLPEGWKTFWAFYNENLPKVELANKRYAALPLKGCIVSKRIRDKQEHTLVRAEIGLRPYSLAPVTFVSNAYAGRCDKKVALFHPWWQQAQALLNPIFDSNKYLWSDLSEEDYQAVVNLLKDFHE